MQLEFPDLLQKSDKDKYDFHLKDFTNPHKVTCNQIGALPKSGSQTFSGNLTISTSSYGHFWFKDTTNMLGNGRLGFVNNATNTSIQLIVSEDSTNENRNIFQITRTHNQKAATENTITFQVRGKTATDSAETVVTYNILTSLGGTMGYLNCTGIAKKTNTADDITSQHRFRNIYGGQNAPSSLENGEIFLQY